MSPTVRIIGAPTDYGANRRGVDMGPSAIRYGDLAEAVSDAGVDVSDVGDLFAARAGERAPDDGVAQGDAKYLSEIREVSERLADEVADCIEAGQTPLTLGGDHSIAIGTLAGSGRDAEIGAVWFDAHGDFNTPATSPSGNVHGMPLAAALGRGSFDDHPWARSAGLSAENVALVGLRSVDERESEALRDSAVSVYTMSDIDARGLTRVVEDALDIATDGVEGFHVSLDLDWLDPSEAPGVGTPVRGGVSYREAHAAMERVAARDAADGADLRSMELVEVNPILDQHNETAELATELAASALGKRIL
ncbi:arginase [Natronoarchaeum philippinense]|uniref:Arginase n=1 Tax=Natronoarchaeum philippinense TaxID=558529 RepID=A0A285N4L2_NATPI|nr:arginase [Natronoarchaeum philippinense]SNZ04415.1 arginase [Natronoarchaeum philippinense]